MFGDFYVELSRILPKKVCFSSDNLKKEQRDKNLEKAIEIVDNFIIENPIYKTRFIELFGNMEYSMMIKDILAGYVFYNTDNIHRNTGADVFLDKRSICYTKFSILDII